jgi:hypothetical protein
MLHASGTSPIRLGEIRQENRRSRRYALTIGIAALLAGCGGSQPPIGPPDPMAQSQAIATHAERGGSWMAADAVSQDLLYTGNVGSVTVYSYPKGQLKGMLSGFGDVDGMCADSAGDVFVLDFMGDIVEYAHGARYPKKKLRSPHGSAIGCSVDPASGDLAVAAYAYSNAAVEIYRNAKGPPKSYQDPSFKQYYHCGYDNKGNLFVDGITSSSAFVFAELPKGGTALKTITLNQSIGFPNQVQWDGKYITVGDETTPAIYQFTIMGSEGDKVGTTSLNHVTFLDQSWIQGQTLIAPVVYYKKRQAHAEILFYKYPSGGKPTKLIPHSSTDGPNSAAISLAPS